MSAACQKRLTEQKNCKILNIKKHELKILSGLERTE